MGENKKKNRERKRYTECGKKTEKELEGQGAGAVRSWVLRCEALRAPKPWIENSEKRTNMPAKICVKDTDRNQFIVYEKNDWKINK